MMIISKIKMMKMMMCQYKIEVYINAYINQLH